MDNRFRVLISHFFGRFFDKETRADESDPRVWLIQLLSMLVVPGLMLAVFMITDHPMAVTALDRLWARVGDRYVFVCYSMVVMGLVMTFKWDSLFPDRRDYLVLTSLPISARRLFAAKVIALGAFLGLFVTAINVFPLFIAPMVYGGSSGRFPQALLAHALGAVGGSVFTALFFAAFQGVLINILPPNTFRRISPWIQMVSMAVLVTTFLVVPLAKDSIRGLAESNNHILDYIPMMWFLGLYESFLPGGTTMPMSVAWATTAFEALLATAGVFVVSYLVGYRRHARRVLESLDSDAIRPKPWAAWGAGILNRSVLRSPTQRASFYFIGKIAGRSATHRILTALYLGIGVALALSSLFVIDRRAIGFPFHLSMRGALEGPIILSFLIVSGMRATFNVPYELGANWLFQVGGGTAADFLTAIRKWIFLRRIVPMYTAVAIFELAVFDERTAISHLAFDLALTGLLIEVFFFNFNKVPFTCAHMRDKFRLAGIAVAYLYGFTMYVAGMGELKGWASVSVLRTLATTAVLGAVAIALSTYRRIARDRSARIVYNDSEAVLLSLTADHGYAPPPRKTWFRETVPLWTRMEHLLQDVRFGSRILWKSPALSSTAVILIALVIGGNTTIYSMIHGMLTNPAPGVTAQNLVSLGLTIDGRPDDPSNSYPNYLDYVAQSQTLDSIVAIGFDRFTAAVENANYAYDGALVTRNYFETLGVHLIRGRTFNELESRSDAQGLSAVIGYQVWQEQFHGDEDILGREIALNGHPATIVGVVPPRFQGTGGGALVKVWVPLLTYYRLEDGEQALQDRGTRSVYLIGSLKRGVPIARAQAEFRTISRRLQDAYAEVHGWSAIVAPYSSTAIALDARSRQIPVFMAIFSTVTVLTLAIVCANVANLMLARAVVRQRETAVRVSLGAPRARLLRILVGEGLAIAMASWAAAILVSIWVSRAIPGWLPTNGRGLRLDFDFTPDSTVAAYAMALAVLAMLAFTIVPAIRTWTQDTLPWLKGGEHSVAQGRSRLSSGLVILQLAFSVVLLTSAGLAYRSFSVLDTIDVGFRTNNLLLTTVTTRNGSLETVRQRLLTIPGVGSVSHTRPMGMQIVQGAAAQMIAIGPDYLKALGLSPASGRDFTREDGGVSQTAIVNRNLAETLWPGQAAVGRTLILRGRSLQIIGVAPNAVFGGNQDSTRPNFLFVPETSSDGEVTFYIRYAGALDATATAIRATMQQADPNMAVAYMRTMESQLANANETVGIVTGLLSLFSGITLAIAATGQYAVVAFNMRRRTRDFGVRMAVGASSSQILTEVLREGLALTIAGLALGFLFSLGASQVTARFLSGVTPTDPATYAAVFVLLAAASLLACYLPARRASRIDPLQALRQE